MEIPPSTSFLAEELDRFLQEIEVDKNPSFASNHGNQHNLARPPDGTPMRVTQQLDTRTYPNNPGAPKTYVYAQGGAGTQGLVSTHYCSDDEIWSDDESNLSRFGRRWYRDNVKTSRRPNDSSHRYGRAQLNRRESRPLTHSSTPAHSSSSTASTDSSKRHSKASTVNFCKICNLHIEDPEAFKIHCDGLLHMRKVAEKKGQEILQKARKNRLQVIERMRQTQLQHRKPKQTKIQPQQISESMRQKQDEQQKNAKRVQQKGPTSQTTPASQAQAVTSVAGVNMSSPVPHSSSNLPRQGQAPTSGSHSQVVPSAFPMQSDMPRPVLSLHSTVVPQPLLLVPAPGMAQLMPHPSLPRAFVPREAALVQPFRMGPQAGMPIPLGHFQPPFIPAQPAHMAQVGRLENNQMPAVAQQSKANNSAYFCELCDAGLNSEVDWQKHVQGDQHRKKLTEMVGPEEPKPKLAGKVTQDEDAALLKTLLTGLYCKLCDQKFKRYNDFEVHMKSAQHVKKYWKVKSEIGEVKFKQMYGGLLLFKTDQDILEYAVDMKKVQLMNEETGSKGGQGKDAKKSKTSAMIAIDSGSTAAPTPSPSIGGRKTKLTELPPFFKQPQIKEGMFYCYLCNLKHKYVPEVWVMHVTGRRHMEALKKKKTEVGEESCTLLYGDLMPTQEMIEFGKAILMERQEKGSLQQTKNTERMRERRAQIGEEAFRKHYTDCMTDSEETPEIFTEWTEKRQKMAILQSAHGSRPGTSGSTQSVSPGVSGTWVPSYHRTDQRDDYTGDRHRQDRKNPEHKRQHPPATDQQIDQLKEALKRKFSGIEGGITSNSLEYLWWQLKRQQQGLDVGNISEFELWQKQQAEERGFEDWQQTREEQGKPRGTPAQYELEKKQKEEFEDWQLMREEQGLQRGTQHEFEMHQKRLHSDCDYNEWQQSRAEQGLRKGTFREYNLWKRTLQEDRDYIDWQLQRIEQGSSGKGTYREYMVWRGILSEDTEYQEWQERRKDDGLAPGLYREYKDWQKKMQEDLEYVHWQERRKKAGVSKGLFREYEDWQKRLQKDEEYVHWRKRRIEAGQTPGLFREYEDWLGKLQKDPEYLEWQQMRQDRNLGRGLYEEYESWQKNLMEDKEYMGWQRRRVEKGLGRGTYMEYENWCKQLPNNKEYMDWQHRRGRAGLGKGVYQEFEDWQRKLEEDPDYVNWKKDKRICGTGLYRDFETWQRKLEKNQEYQDWQRRRKDTGLGKGSYMEYEDWQRTLNQDPDYMEWQQMKQQKGQAKGLYREYKDWQRKLQADAEYMYWQKQRQAAGHSKGSYREYESWLSRIQDDPEYVDWQKRRKDAGHGRGLFGEFQDWLKRLEEDSEYVDWQKRREAAGHRKGLYRDFQEWIRRLEEDREFVDWQRRREAAGLSKGLYRDFNQWLKRLDEDIEYVDWQKRRQAAGLGKGLYRDFDQWLRRLDDDIEYVDWQKRREAAGLGKGLYRDYDDWLRRLEEDIEYVDWQKRRKRTGHKKGLYRDFEDWLRRLDQDMEYMDWQERRKCAGLKEGLYRDFEDWLKRLDSDIEYVDWQKRREAAGKGRGLYREYDEWMRRLDEDIEYIQWQKRRDDAGLKKGLYRDFEDWKMRLGEDTEYVDWQKRRRDAGVEKGLYQEFEDWMRRLEEDLEYMDWQRRREASGVGKGLYRDYEDWLTRLQEDAEYVTWQRRRQEAGLEHGLFRDYELFQLDIQEDRDFVDWQRRNQNNGLDRGLYFEYLAWCQRIQEDDDYIHWQRRREERGHHRGTFMEYEDWRCQRRLDDHDRLTAYDSGRTSRESGEWHRDRAGYDDEGQRRDYRREGSSDRVGRGSNREFIAEDRRHGISPHRWTDDRSQRDQEADRVSQEEWIMQQAQEMLGVDNPAGFMTSLMEAVANLDPESLQVLASLNQDTIHYLTTGHAAVDEMSQILTPEVIDTLAGSGIDARDLMRLLESVGMERLTGIAHAGVGRVGQRERRESPRPRGRYLPERDARDRDRDRDHQRRDRYANRDMRVRNYRNTRSRSRERSPKQDYLGQDRGYRQDRKRGSRREDSSHGGHRSKRRRDLY